MDDKALTAIKDDFCRKLQEGNLTGLQRSKLVRELVDSVSQTLGEGAAEDLDHLSAPNAVVEIIDDKTGILFRRYLEIEFEENDNGIRLMGEDMSGDPAQIVFLSESALKKMHDLRGHGPNEHVCDNHQ